MEFLQPEQIVKAFDIKKGMRVADFGAGSGYFVMPLARLVGDTGKVSAIDVQKDALDAIKGKAKVENLANIETIWADLELSNGSKLPENSQDAVLMSNILFQIENRSAIFQEAYRITKPGGMLFVFEWNQTTPPPGPPLDYRVSREAVVKYAIEANFHLGRDFAAGSHHYGILFKK